MKRFVYAALASVSLIGVSALPASAGASWCEDDPPVQLVTPDHHKVVVHVSDFGALTGSPSADREIRKAVASATITAHNDQAAHQVQVVDGIAQAGTVVPVTVLVPSAVDRASGAVMSFQTYTSVRLKPKGPAIAESTPHTSGAEQTISVWVPVL